LFSVSSFGFPIRFWRQGLHMGNGQPEPVLHSLPVQRRGIYIDVALHRPTPHHHRTCTGLQCLGLTVFPYTEEQATAGRRGNQVAVQHETNPAKHLDFADVASSGESDAHIVGKLLIIGHCVPPVSLRLVAGACNHPNVPSIPFSFAIQPNHVGRRKKD
jgi:hypothetical protein